jgi:hypothetical protein
MARHRKQRSRESVSGVFDPDTGGTKELRITRSRLDWIYKSAPPWMATSAAAAMATLRAPEYVFEGLSRDGQEQGRCYVSRPPFRVLGDGARVPATPGEALLVFHTEEEFIHEWRWIDFRGDGFDSLLDYCLGNFDKQLWPRT